MHQPVHNRTYLKDTRRTLRNNLTSAEATLWKYLSRQQLEGKKFRRQHSIENYIVDFYCASEKLIIELDGGIHENLGQSNADFDRDSRLTELGFLVLRFENVLVFSQIDTVLERIKEHLTKVT
jgi:very-short-patch-repair endonuclease